MQNVQQDKDVIRYGLERVYFVFAHKFDKMSTDFHNARVIGLHFCRWLYRSTFIQILAVDSERSIFSAMECISAVQGHPRSLILAPIERAYGLPISD